MDLDLTYYIHTVQNFEYMKTYHNHKYVDTYAHLELVHTKNTYIHTYSTYIHRYIHTCMHTCIRMPSFLTCEGIVLKSAFLDHIISANCRSYVRTYIHFYLYILTFIHTYALVNDNTLTCIPHAWLAALDDLRKYIQFKCINTVCICIDNIHTYIHTYIIQIDHTYIHTYPISLYIHIYIHIYTYMQTYILYILYIHT
jgi:hypothetical protein